jgi:enamine deaminase RidA (YjgF/YER057c/UK114 family)
VSDLDDGRQRHSTGTEWEARVGYSRAIRVGDLVYVAGTLGVGADGTPPEGAYEQSVAAFERIGAALEAMGGSVSDVVRTRMYVVDVEQNQFDVGRAHSEWFGSVMPASTMLGVSGFVDPAFLVEVEVDAVIDEG